MYCEYLTSSFCSSNFLGPAPESVTNEIYKHTTSIKEYYLAQFDDVSWHSWGVNICSTFLQIDLSTKSTHKFENGFEVDVIDSVADYAELMSSIFDFPLIRSFLEKTKFKILIDSLNGVTGVYTTHIFCDLLGAPKTSVINNTPLEDFGGWVDLMMTQ